MNLNLVNLEPEQWSRTDWQDAYASYCKTNMFGPKTKKEYYDMVLENFHKLAQQQKPLSDELSEQWLKGWHNAVAYARANKCDMNGRLLADVHAEAENRSTREIAKRAEDMAVELVQRLDDLDEKIYQAKLRRTQK